MQECTTVLFHRKKTKNNHKNVRKTCYWKLIFVICSYSTWARRHASTQGTPAPKASKMWARRYAIHVGMWVRKHGRYVATSACKHTKHVGTLVREHVRKAKHVGTWARKHAKHIGTWARKHAKHVGLWARKHARHVCTWARKHARHVGTWARKARNLADSFEYAILSISNLHLYSFIGCF